MTVADNSNRKTVDLDAVIRSNLANACVPRLDESNCERNLCYNAYFRWMLLAFYFLAFFTFETVLRTMDGTCNNLQNPLRGAAYRPYTRLLPTVYDNELSEPVGERFLNPPSLRYFLTVTQMVLEELLLAVSMSSFFFQLLCSPNYGRLLVRLRDTSLHLTHPLSRKTTTP